MRQLSKMAPFPQNRFIAFIVILLIACALIIGSRNTLPVQKEIKEIKITKSVCNCNFCMSMPSVPIPYGNVYHGDPCVERPQQDSLDLVLAFASRKKCDQKKLYGRCIGREYIYQTLDEPRRRILKMYTQLALDELNHRSYMYTYHVAQNCPLSPTGEKRVLKPFHFAFVEFISATCSVDKGGNSRWRVDIMVEELQLHFSQRIILDFTVEVKNPNKWMKNKFATCAEYTTFPFPKYFIGYPAIEQSIPLPTEVIVTGRDILSTKGIDPEWPNFKALWLNAVWQKNSDLALGTELPVTLDCGTAPAKNDTNLESSAYPKNRIIPPDVSFPEMDYAKAIEESGLAIDNDITANVNQFRKPCRYDCTGEPENLYHLQGSSETYKQSMVAPTWPNGWIQPAKWRNKWPRLWSEPRDRFAWPSTLSGPTWDHQSVLMKADVNDTHPGVRSSTRQEPRTPQYWPTITGLPVNAGPNNWLFDNLRGGQATDGATRPTR